MPASLKYAVVVDTRNAYTIPLLTPMVNADINNFKSFVSKILLTEVSRGTISDKILKMADGVGFEPTVRVNARRFSRPVP